MPLMIFSRGIAWHFFMERRTVFLAVSRSGLYSMMYSEGSYAEIATSGQWSPRRHRATDKQSHSKRRYGYFHHVKACSIEISSVSNDVPQFFFCFPVWIEH